MPFVLIIIGLVFLISGVKDTQDDLLALLKGDFTGQHNYIYWMVSILIVGAVGYVDELKPVSRAFLVLVIIVLFLSNGGFFAKFNEQLFSQNTTGSKGLQITPVITTN